MFNFEETLKSIKPLEEWTDEEKKVFTTLMESLPSSKFERPSYSTKTPFKCVDMVFQVQDNGTCNLHVLGNSDVYKNLSIDSAKELALQYNDIPFDINYNNGDVYVDSIKVNGFNVIFYTDGSYLLTKEDYSIADHTDSSGSSTGYSSVYLMKDSKI